MTTEILQTSILDLDHHRHNVHRHFNFNNNYEYAPIKLGNLFSPRNNNRGLTNGNSGKFSQCLTTTKKSSCEFAVPRIPQKPRVSETPKHVLKLEIKARRNPSVLKREVIYQVTRREMSKILVQQALQQEKSCVKMLGVAVFYTSLLKNLDGHHCPMCSQQCESAHLLDMKIKKDVNYFIEYVPKSSARRERDALLLKLIMNGSVIPSYCTNSEKLVKFLKAGQDLSAVDLKELQMGMRDALRLLKVTLLKNRKCGVCDGKILGEKVTVASVLAKIDQRLAEIN